MKLRRLFCLAVGLEVALAATVAHSSYVVEADGMGIDQHVNASSADFDFVARDFGIEPKAAIQIALDNLSRAENLRGNLLLGTAESVDYSYYGEESAEGVLRSNTLAVDSVSGDKPLLFSVAGEPAAEGDHAFSSIDASAFFSILSPTEFTSFSRLTAARFGFDYSQ